MVPGGNWDAQDRRQDWCPISVHLQGCTHASGLFDVAVVGAAVEVDVEVVEVRGSSSPPRQMKHFRWCSSETYSLC